MVADDRPVKNQAFYLVRALSGFSVDPAREGGGKLTRFGPFSSQCRAGNVKIRRGAWNEELFRVLEGFPDLAHDDEVDACSLGNAQYRQCRAGPRMKSRAKTPRRSVPRRNANRNPLLLASGAAWHGLFALISENFAAPVTERTLDRSAAIAFIAVAAEHLIEDIPVISR